MGSTVKKSIKCRFYFFLKLPHFQNYTVQARWIGNIFMQKEVRANTCQKKLCIILRFQFFFQLSMQNWNFDLAKKKLNFYILWLDKFSESPNFILGEWQREHIRGSVALEVQSRKKKKSCFSCGRFLHFGAQFDIMIGKKYCSIALQGVLGTSICHLKPWNLILVSCHFSLLSDLWPTGHVRTVHN